MSSPAVSSSSPSSSSHPSSGGGGYSNHQQTPSSRRPSDDRRERLKEGLSVPTVSNFFPIERYYTAADTVYQNFEDAKQHNRLDEAYVLAKRFCLFSVDAIPTHNYYDAPKYAAHKMRSVRRVNAVLESLERIVDLMDEEELTRQRLEAQRVEQQRQERLHQFQKSYEQQQQRQGGDESTSSNIQASALSKLELLNGRNNGGASIRRDPSGEPPMNNGGNAKPRKSTTRYRVLSDDSDDDDDDDESGLVLKGISLPPPIPPPPSSNGDVSALLPPPPSYDQIRAQQQQQQLQQRKPQAPPKRVPIRSLRDKHRNEYLTFVDKGHIVVSCFNTYQGRINESTNGCTVISALVAANHMIKPDVGSLTNDEVTHIIDNVCGPVLRKIRSKLGLPAHALLIPSDVHDQLVDDKVLSQDCFEGASGGSVLDDEHMGEFLKLLSVGESGKGAHCKAAATFFFREHVISIVKYQDRHRQICYDLIDSLPATIQGRSAATRTTCTNLDALRALLNWYCSRKFSDANCSYIDSNRWDDAMADVDPRVFQGFVWMTKPQ